MCGCIQQTRTFTYKDRVTVTQGFYEGQTGTVLSKGTNANMSGYTNHYVHLDDGHKVNITSIYMEKVK